MSRARSCGHVVPFLLLPEFLAPAVAVHSHPDPDNRDHSHCNAHDQTSVAVLRFDTAQVKIKLVAFFAFLTAESVFQLDTLSTVMVPLFASFAFRPCHSKQAILAFFAAITEDILCTCLTLGDGLGTRNALSIVDSHHVVEAGLTDDISLISHTLVAVLDIHGAQPTTSVIVLSDVPIATC